MTLAQKRNTGLKILVLVTSATQLLSPLLSSLNDQSGTGTQVTNPKITPAGYAFVVWGVITILSFAYGIYQLRSNKINESLHGRLAPRLIAIYVLFSCWLLAAEYQWLAVTVIIFVAMFLLLRSALLETLRWQGTLSFADNVLLKTQLAIYAGWTSVAIFANTASAIKYYGITDEGSAGTLWQSALLILATLNILWGINSLKGNLAFVITTLWAVIGIFVGLLDEPNAAFLRILTAALGSIVIVYVVLFLRRRRDLQVHPTGH
jgi:hypothetical protein